MAKRRNDFAAAVNQDLNEYEASNNISTLTPVPAQRTATVQKLNTEKSAVVEDKPQKPSDQIKVENKNEKQKPGKKPGPKKKQFSLYLPEEMAEQIKAPIMINKEISQYLIKLIEEDLKKNGSMYNEYIETQRKFGIDI